MSKLSKKDFEKIHNVLRLFNFKQCHDILQFIHDNYEDKGLDENGEPEIPFVITCPEVPSIDKLENTAYRLLTEVIEEDLQYVASGWMRAEKTNFTDYPDDYELTLIFDVISNFEEAEEPKEPHEQNH